MQKTDPVEIADIEKAADLNSEEMTAIKGGVSPIIQIQAGSATADATTDANGKVSNSGITVA